MSVAIAAIVWAVVSAVAFLIEGLTVELVSVWFGFGALIAMLAASLGAPFELQLLLFLLSSIGVLLLGRPVAVKRLRVRKQPTNADMVIGQAGVVIADIDNIAQTGRVHVNGLDWSARSMHGQPIPAGEKVLILQIDGVKLIVEPVLQPQADGEALIEEDPSGEA